VFDIYVVKKGEFDEVADFVGKLKNSASNNPIVFAGVLVVVLFVILFLAGSSSSGQEGSGFD